MTLTEFSRNAAASGAVTTGMQLSADLSPQVLDDDLQLVRVTLAQICEDISRLSPRAGRVVWETLNEIDAAHAEFVRCVEES